MAVRITHTNNSDGHDGTFVYRSTSTIDPQSLPAPIADEPPVALGAVFEYIDNISEDGTYFYRTQDHEGGQVSTVSDEVSVVVGDDFSTAQIGDEIGGGIYAGKITYADAREFHIVSAKASGEATGLIWSSDTSTTTGANDPDDGLANHQDMLANHDNGNLEVFYHCRDYVDAEGNTDYYPPSRNELTHIYNNLAGHSEFADNVASGVETWSSTESNSDQAWMRILADGTEFDFNKDYVNPRTRPIRRAAV